MTAIAENQARIAEDCAAQGWIDFIGWHEAVSVERLMKELEQMGAGRIVDMLQSYRSADLWENIEKNYI